MFSFGPRFTIWIVLLTEDFPFFILHLRGLYYLFYAVYVNLEDSMVLVSFNRKFILFYLTVLVTLSNLQTLIYGNILLGC